LIGGSHAAGVASPTMDGDTLYSGYNRSADSNGLLGSGNHPGSGTPGMMSALSLGGAGAGMAMGNPNGPGMRTSGIVLPRVKDENQTAPDKWIETGAEVSVLWPYQATLPDELELKPGMRLRVLRLYDDAWGTGLIIGGHEDGRQGAFPVVSLDIDRLVLRAKADGSGVCIGGLNVGVFRFGREQRRLALEPARDQWGLAHIIRARLSCRLLCSCFPRVRALEKQCNSI
jgi:hypothetical protein